MYDRLKRRLAARRERRRLARAVRHLDARTLRDIGLDPWTERHPVSLLLAPRS